MASKEKLKNTHWLFRLRKDEWRIVLSYILDHDQSECSDAKEVIRCFLNFSDLKLPCHFTYFEWKEGEHERRLLCHLYVFRLLDKQELIFVKEETISETLSVLNLCFDRGFLGLWKLLLEKLKVDKQKFLTSYLFGEEKTKTFKDNRDFLDCKRFAETRSRRSICILWKFLVKKGTFRSLKETNLHELNQIPSLINLLLPTLAWHSTSLFKTYWNNLNSPFRLGWQPKKEQQSEWTKRVIINSLLLASEGGNLGSLKYLEKNFRYYCNQVPQKLKMSIFISVMKKGHLKILKRLEKILHFGEETCRRDLIVLHPLVLACEIGNVSILKYLETLPESIQCQWQIDEEYKNGFESAFHRGNLQIIEYLYQTQGNSVDAKITMDKFVRVCEKGYLGLVREFLSHRTPDPFGGRTIGTMNALKIACSSGHLEIVRLLQMNFNFTPYQFRWIRKGTLGEICQRGYLEILKFIHSEFKLNVDDIRDQKYKALLLASENGQKEIVHYLFETFPSLRTVLQKELDQISRSFESWLPEIECLWREYVGKSPTIPILEDRSLFNPFAFPGID
jgi:hypothetical protein